MKHIAITDENCWKRRKYRGTTIEWPLEGDEYLALQRGGCDCCTTNVEITKESLADAIHDAIDWLQFLQQLALEAGE